MDGKADLGKIDTKIGPSKADLGAKGLNGIAKVTKRSCRSGIRTRPGPSGRQSKPTPLTHSFNVIMIMRALFGIQV